MASIERLQISGIRSFNPEPSRAQTVHFAKPLTVILGKNGAGKTTIIEALLFACTGAMPPGSGGSEKSSFVYDPKIMGAGGVKAQIRLIFTAVDGCHSQVIRSLQVTRTSKKTELKTLDNTVAHQDRVTGKVVSNTYRSGDVDRAVPGMMGVTAPVLKYVVFCHQEESNWPLSPPKEMKVIFDGLFSASRYVATLEKLRAVGSEKRKQLKDYEASLFALREHREQADSLAESIAKKEDHIKEIELGKTKHEPELAALRKASGELDRSDQQVDALSRESAQIAGRMDEKRETVRRANLPPSAHTLEQVVELKGNLAAEVKKAESVVSQRAKAAGAVQQAAGRHQEEVFKLRAQVQSQQREDQQHKANVADLRGLLESMPEILGGDEEGPMFIASEDSVDEGSLARVLQAASEAAKDARSEARAALQEVTDRVSAEDDKCQLILRGMEAVNKEREMTESMLSSLTRQLGEARGALQALDAGATRERFAQARADVVKLQKRVEAAEAVRQKGEHAQRRERIGREFDEQNATVASLRQAMATARQREGQEGDLGQTRTHLEERRRHLAESMQAVVAPMLAALRIDMDPKPGDFTAVCAKVEETHRTTEAAQVAARDADTALDRQSAALGQKCAHLADQLSHHQSEAADKVAACSGILDTTGPAAATSFDRYEELLTEARAACEQSVTKRHTLEAMAACYGEFAKAAQASNSCAVCDRPFASHGEMHRAVQRNEELQLTSPAAMMDAQVASAASEARLRKLESIQRAVQDVRRLRALIPALERELGETEAELERVDAESAAAGRRLREASDALRGVTNLVYQLQNLRGVDNEVTVLKAKVSARDRRLAEERSRAAAGGRASSPPPEGTAGKTYKELIEAYEAATVHLHRLSEQMAEVQRMEEGSAENAAQKELPQRQHVMHQLELAVAKAADLQATLDRLNEERAIGSATLQTLQNRRAEHQRELEAVQKVLQTLREERKKIEQAGSKTVATTEGHFRQLEVAAPRVLAHIKGGGGKRLTGLRDQLAAAEAANARAAADAEALSKEISDAQSTLAEHGRRMVQADRIIAVLETEKSLEADAALLRDIEKALAELKRAQLPGAVKILGESAMKEPLPQVREMIRAKMSALEKAQAQQQGTVEAMQQDVIDLKAQLAKDKFSAIETRYNAAFLKAQAEALTLKDIDNYYTALEVSVQQYHTDRITQINQIIGELWRQTYRGGDIDTIEIRSESELTASSAVKRSYTYRVVIKRGENELDMRGRCSAGQKVLASIIIRLALSEAFCYNCGILALDEPTTNLDEDNAQSLAESLRSLIELKRDVKNFQLVVITHDEQFVRALGGQHLESFHYVQKDPEGAFSIIEKRTFNQLFT